MSDGRDGEERGPSRIPAPISRLLRDPAGPGLILLGTLILIGAVAILLAWAGAARAIYVPLQIPEILSGGVLGLTLIGIGAALMSLQVDRRDSARDRALTDEALAEMAEVMALEPKLRRIAERRRSGRSRPVPSGERGRGE